MNTVHCTGALSGEAGRRFTFQKPLFAEVLMWEETGKDSLGKL